jgi:hypothetical protein
MPSKALAAYMTYEDPPVRTVSELERFGWIVLQTVCVYTVVWRILSAVILLKPVFYNFRSP